MYKRKKKKRSKRRKFSSSTEKDELLEDYLKCKLNIKLSRGELRGKGRYGVVCSVTTV